MNDINNILAKHFSSTQLNDEEQLILDDWMSKNKAEYDALNNSWSSVPKFDYKEFNTQSAWQKVESKINQKTKSKTKVFPIKPFLKYAVAASVLLAVMFGGYKLFGTSSNNFVAFTNQSNQVKTLNLEDGTTIYLAKHTTIEYQENFKNNRNIKLEGEAFFDVHRDENHPFVIKTNYGDVEVLGTSFDVNTKNNKTTVSVKSGKVELRNLNNKIILTKNESAFSDGKVVSNKSSVNENYLAWKTGEFKFNNTPLEKVVNILNSYYDTTIELSKNINKNMPFSGEFKQENLDIVIDAITLSCNLTAETYNNKIILK